MSWDNKMPVVPGIYWARERDRCGKCWRYDLVRVQRGWISGFVTLAMFGDGFSPDEFWHEPVKRPESDT